MSREAPIRDVLNTLRATPISARKPSVAAERQGYGANASATKPQAYASSLASPRSGLPSPSIAVLPAQSLSLKGKTPVQVVQVAPAPPRRQTVEVVNVQADPNAFDTEDVSLAEEFDALTAFVESKVTNGVEEVVGKIDRLEQAVRVASQASKDGLESVYAALKDHKNQTLALYDLLHRFVDKMDDKAGSGEQCDAVVEQQLQELMRLQVKGQPPNPEVKKFYYGTAKPEDDADAEAASAAPPASSADDLQVPLSQQSSDAQQALEDAEINQLLKESVEAYSAVLLDGEGADAASLPPLLPPSPDPTDEQKESEDHALAIIKQVFMDADNQPSATDSSSALGAEADAVTAAEADANEDAAAAAAAATTTNTAASDATTSSQLEEPASFQICIDGQTTSASTPKELIDKVMAMPVSVVRDFAKKNGISTKGTKADLVGRVVRSQGTCAR